MYGAECQWLTGLIVGKFQLESCYYIHFQTNTLGEGMNPLTHFSAKD